MDSPYRGSGPPTHPSKFEELQALANQKASRLAAAEEEAQRLLRELRIYFGLDHESTAIRATRTSTSNGDKKILVYFTMEVAINPDHTLMGKVAKGEVSFYLSYNGNVFKFERSNKAVFEYGLGDRSWVLTILAQELSEAVLS